LRASDKFKVFILRASALLYPSSANFFVTKRHIVRSTLSLFPCFCLFVLTILVRLPFRAMISPGKQFFPFLHAIPFYWSLCFFLGRILFTNNANNAIHYVKLGKKRRESSKRKNNSFPSRVIIKAIIIISFLLLTFPSCSNEFSFGHTLFLVSKT